MKGFLLSLIFINLCLINFSFALPEDPPEKPPLDSSDSPLSELEAHVKLKTIHISAKAEWYVTSLLSSLDPVSDILTKTGKFLSETGQEQLIEDLQLMIQTELEKPFQMYSFVETREKELQAREQKINEQEQKAQTKQEKRQIKKEKKQIEKEKAQVEEGRVQIDWNWEDIVISAIEKFFKQHEFVLGRHNVKRHLKRLKKTQKLKLKEEIGYLEGFLRELNIDTSKKEILQRIFNHLRNKELNLAKDSLLGRNPPISDEKTLERILTHFKLKYKPNDFLSYANRIKYFNQSGKNISSNDWNRKVSLELESSLILKRGSLIHRREIGETAYEFAAIVKEGYRGPLSRSYRKAIDLLHQILKAERIGKKEVADFRDILNLLQLPPEFHNNEFIRHYLSSIQMPEIQKLYKTAHVEYDEIITDKQALFLLSKIEKSFEKPHYDLLKDQTKFKNFILGFPIQFLIYYMSVGGVIFLEHFITDPMLYQSHKNPVPLETWIQGLGFEAWFSLGLFIYASSHTQFQVYKLGNKRKSNLLKAMATPAAMAGGYLFSTVLIEIYNDKELHECAKNMVKRYKENKHITSCEASALQWNSRFFVDLGPDILTMLSAGWLSNALMTRLALWIRASKLGERILVHSALRLGRLASPVSGILQILSFLLINEATDRYLTRLSKEWLFKRRVNSGTALINSQLTVGVLASRMDLLKDELTRFTQTEMGKSLKDFLAQTDEEITLYEYLLAQTDEEGNLEDLLLSQETDEENGFKKLLKVINDLQERWKILIEKAKELDFNFEKWNDVKGLHYRQAFQGWKAQTEQLIYSFQVSKTLLREIYTFSHKTQIGPVNKYFDEITTKRKQQLEALTIEYTNLIVVPEEVFEVCKLPVDKPLIKERINDLSMEFKEDKSEGKKTAAEVYISHFTPICLNSQSLIFKSHYDFFSFSLKKLQEPQFIHAAEFVCANYEEYIIELELEEWFSLCYSSKISEDTQKFQSDTIRLIGRILNSPEFEHLDEIQIDKPEDYIGWGINEIFSSDKKISSFSFTKKLALARQLLNPEYLFAPEERVRAEWLHRLCESEYFAGHIPDLLCPEIANEEVFIEQWVRLRDNPGFVESTENSGTLNFIDGFLYQKAKTAGFYLLKEALNDYRMAIMKNTSPHFISYMRLRAIADPIEVHKKGEELLNIFSESEESHLIAAGLIQDRILQALICGTEEGKISSDFLFIPPQIFIGAESLCESHSAENNASFTGSLFKNPVTFNGKHYETAYLALEEWIQERFKTEENLMDLFKDKTLHLKEKVYQTKLKDLDNLVDNFLIPSLIPSKERSGMSCSELKSRYDNQLEDDFEGLEVPLLQVNYNLNQLKRLKELGVEGNVNRDNQDDIHCEVLELLQGWYDNYVNNNSWDGKPDSLIFPEISFLKELMEKAEKEGTSFSLERTSLIKQIQKRYFTNLVYIDKAFLFHDILREFAPEYNDIRTVMEKIDYGNAQFSNEVNQQFANWDAGKWWSVSPFIVGAYKTVTDRSDEEIQDNVGAVMEGQTCEYPQKALADVIAGEKEPHYRWTFPPVQAPILENCKLGFNDEMDRMIYTTLVSLYESLDRFYTSFGFLVQTQKLKSDFER